jgi:hypothetical protein
MGVSSKSAHRGAIAVIAVAVAAIPLLMKPPTPRPSTRLCVRLTRRSPVCHGVVHHAQRLLSLVVLVNRP